MTPIDTRAAVFRSVAAAALAVIVSAPFAMLLPAAEAATVDQQGWWYRRTTGPAGLPLGSVEPPETKPGELVVEGAPDGATAMAAIRFSLAAGESPARLELRLREGSQLSADASILACPVTTAWAPADAGEWNAKPKPDETACTAGQVAADGASVSWDASGLAKAGVVDVAIVPGQVSGLPAGLNGSTFQAIFRAPSGSLATTGPPAASAGPAENVLPPAASAPAGVEPAPASASFAPPPPVASSPSGAPPPAAQVEISPGEPAASPAPALPPEDLSFADIPEVEPAAGYRAPATGSGRAFGALVLASALGAAAYAWRAGDATPTEERPIERGLGRFRRPRSTPPPNLA